MFALPAAILLASCAARPAWDMPGAALAKLAGRDVVQQCREASPAACEALDAALAMHDKPTPRQRAALYSLRLDACGRGQGTACDRLTYEHVFGDRENLEPQRAQDVLVVACDQGHASSCHAAGASLDEGKLGFVDEVGAYVLLRKGCEGQHPASCAWVGLKLDFGRGVAQDRDASFAFYDKACKLGENKVGCFNVALQLWERPPAERDGQQVLWMFRDACSAGTQAACDNMAVVKAATPLTPLSAMIEAAVIEGQPMLGPAPSEVLVPEATHQVHEGYYGSDYDPHPGSNAVVFPRTIEGPLGNHTQGLFWLVATADHSVLDGPVWLDAVMTYPAPEGIEGPDEMVVQPLMSLHNKGAYPLGVDRLVVHDLDGDGELEVSVDVSYQPPDLLDSPYTETLRLKITDDTITQLVMP